MKGKKIVVSIFCLVIACSIMACGKKDKSIETFKTEIETFSSNINEINEKINNIDPNSSTATEDLLSAFDEIDAEFIALAKLTVPGDFANVEVLADKASEYMTTAVSLYHQAFADNEYNPTFADQASQYYAEAIEKVQYIGLLLCGESISTDSTTEDTSFTIDESIDENLENISGEDVSGNDVSENNTESLNTTTDTTDTIPDTTETSEDETEPQYILGN